MVKQMFSQEIIRSTPTTVRQNTTMSATRKNLITSSMEERVIAGRR